ncbi:MAG: DUF167 family protein [Dehalococcoidia bacterium]
MKVQPGAARDEVVGLVGGVLRVRVAAIPVKDRANAALVALLARVVGVNRNSIAILRGAAGRTKVVAVEGLGEAEVLERLARHGGGEAPGGSSAR